MVTPTQKYPHREKAAGKVVKKVLEGISDLVAIDDKDFIDDIFIDFPEKPYGERNRNTKKEDKERRMFLPAFSCWEVIECKRSDGEPETSQKMHWDVEPPHNVVEMPVIRNTVCEKDKQDERKRNPKRKVPFHEYVHGNKSTEGRKTPRSPLRCGVSFIDVMYSDGT